MLQSEELLQRALDLAVKYNEGTSIAEMNVLSAMGQHYK